MTQFKVLYALRTDGLTETRLKNGKTETNEPTLDQLSTDLKTDPKTGARIQDYYRLLKEGDAKHNDWRIKLGAMYAKYCGTEEMKGSSCPPHLSLL
jgi:hypothetical protein